VHCPYVENHIDMDAAWILSVGGVEPRWKTRPSKSLTNMLHIDATLTVRSVCPVIILYCRIPLFSNTSIVLRTIDRIEQ
jgi:hypothetical protein